MFYTDESDESLVAMMRRLAAGQQQILELVPALPSAILAALAPEIRPMSYDMSAMSRTRLQDVLMSKAITLTRHALRQSRTSTVQFRMYDWRPEGRPKDLAEKDASAGEPPEFSTPSKQQHHRAASSSASSAALLPFQGVPLQTRQRALSESHTSAAPARSIPVLRVARTVVLSTTGTDILSGVTTLPSAIAALHPYPSLLSHLEAQVPEDIYAARVIFADAQNAPLELPYTVTSTAKTQHVTVRGHPDAAVFHADSAAPVKRVAHDLSLALLLFDWKTPTAMLGNAAAIESQLCSEAIAFSKQYGYNVPVVVTTYVQRFVFGALMEAS